MLRQLPSSHDNGQSMDIYNSSMKHAPSVVIVAWQRSGHRNISIMYKTCSVSCHRVMTTVRAWLFTPKVWNMLSQLSSSHDNGQSMKIYPSSMKHALSIVIVSWQRSEHGNISLKYVTCSVSCHRLMTMNSAWVFIPKEWDMSCQLLSRVNGQSMVIYPSGMKHAPPVRVVIISFQRTEHGHLSLMYETYSVGCHRLMTMVRAWLYTPEVRVMLRPLWSFRENGQSMVIPYSFKKHAPSVVIVSLDGWSMVILYSGKKHAPSFAIGSWQRSEHGYTSFRYITCSASCHRFTTTFRSW